jgi:amidase
MAVMADHAGADNSIPVSEWDYCTIGELVSALRRRTISASELIEHTIARIEALDTRLNAIVVRDFERAREAARAADAALARGERRPLLGVPGTVKEAFNVAGLPTTWGYPQCKEYVPEQDALVVSRLKTIRCFGQASRDPRDSRRTAGSRA